MNSALAPFIGSLLERRLVDLKINGDSDEHFNNRLKLQKYVFLARYYGLDMGYDYNIYLRGPYSRELAKDYYTIAKNPQMLTKPMSIVISDKFFDTISNKDIDWLEAASTLLSLNGFFKDKQMLLNRTINMKKHISSEQIESVLIELERLGLIRFQ